MPAMDFDLAYVLGGFSGRHDPLGLAAGARVTGHDSRVAEAGFSQRGSSTTSGICRPVRRR